jgi:deazaflavin-dependent oxidoreductase (nitroreductase family)
MDGSVLRSSCTAGSLATYRAGVGLADELSYAYRRPNALHRAVQAFASTRVGAWTFAQSLPALDRATDRLTAGRVSLPWSLAGLPTLVLTSTGRRSGRPRETYLIAVPLDDTLALLGTNFGQANTPAWVFNLEAEPRARLTHGDRTRDVVARPATDDERLQVMANSVGVYRGYSKYQQRIRGRRVRIFVLDDRVDRADRDG